MEFGMMDYDNIDFSSLKLKEPDTNFSFPHINLEDRKLYIGLTKWNDPAWKGNLYPDKTPDNQKLSFYSKRFNSIELNATHYKIYSPEEIKKWKDKILNDEFVFCPKMPKTISHFNPFTDSSDSTVEFIQGIRAFGNNLGSVFIQTSEKFLPANLTLLEKYFAHLPKDIQFFLEVRHPSWFSDKSKFEELIQTVRKYNIGLVLTDTPSRRDCAHLRFPIPKTFIRFVGSGMNSIDKKRIENWKILLTKLFEQSFHTVFFFLHMHKEDEILAFADFVEQEFAGII